MLGDRMADRLEMTIQKNLQSNSCFVLFIIFRFERSVKKAFRCKVAQNDGNNVFELAA